MAGSLERFDDAGPTTRPALVTVIVGVVGTLTLPEHLGATLNSGRHSASDGALASLAAAGARSASRVLRGRAPVVPAMDAGTPMRID